MSGGDPYWVSRHIIFKREEGEEDGNVNIKEATKNYATAWSIFAALLMTVSFSLLPLSPDDFYEDNSEIGNTIVSYLYIGLTLMSTIFSFLAVLVGTFRYTYFDGVPAPMIDKAIESIKLPGSETFVYVSMATQMLASTLGCYLFLGIGMLVMALIIFFGLFIPGFAYVCWRYVQSVAGVEGLKRGGAIGAQKMKYDENDGGNDGQTKAVEENQ